MSSNGDTGPRRLMVTLRVLPGHAVTIVVKCEPTASEAAAGRIAP
jgi:hypothetical protein